MEDNTKKIRKIRVTSEGIEMPRELLEELSKMDDVKKNEYVEKMVKGFDIVRNKAASAPIFKTKNQRAIKEFPYLIKILLKKLKINSPIDWDNSCIKYVQLENGIIIRNYNTFMDDEGFMNIQYEIRDVDYKPSLI